MRHTSRWSVALLVVILASLSVLAFASRRVAEAPRPAHNAVLEHALGRRVILWAVGDAGDSSRSVGRVGALLAARHADRTLYLGDVYETGSASDFRRAFAGPWRSLRSGIAPTPGNHDWPSHTDGYDPYWARVTGGPTPPWYAFSAGGWRVLSLNSEAPHDARSAQARWLRRQLRTPGTCRVAFWHRPRFSAGSHGDQLDVAPLWDLLRGHASLVLNGHEHNLQRMRPVSGLVELVAGAGGHSHYALNRSDPRLAWAATNLNGALRIRLTPGRAELSFFSVGGRVLDHSVVRCRRS